MSPLRQFVENTSPAGAVRLVANAGSAAAGLLALAAPVAASACACGCGVFDIGTQNLFPNGADNIAFVSVDYMDQSQNWSGGARARAADNPDREIRGTFVDVGVTHMFDRAWGIQLDAPIGTRTFRTADDGAAAATYRDAAIGDVKITGLWTGLSPDMSTGLTFGLKLPTGDWRARGFDRDTELGAGATDVMLGGYRLGHFASRAPFGWFARVNFDQPFAYSRGYRPGAELDAALGVYHAGWSLGGPFRLKPMLQAIGSWRARDAGAGADPGDTGYQRLVISPGLELQARAWRLNADVGLPAWQRVNGNQLVSPQLLKIALSRTF